MDAPMAHARAKIAGYRRRGRPDDDPDLIQARRALALAKTEDRIRQAIAEAPCLDPETLARLRAIIPPPGPPDPDDTGRAGP